MDRDIANDQTEERIRRVERRLAVEYKKAEEEINKKIQDYFRRFEAKDKIWRQWVASGKKTQAEYQEWRRGQLAVGASWEELRRSIAAKYAKVNEAARVIVEGEEPQVYADNYNWSTYHIERDTGLDTGFAAWSKEAVERLVDEEPDLLPHPKGEKGERLGRDERYNEGRLQSIITQAIIQGDSIPEIAKKISIECGESNYAAAVRNARTAMTSAQNAGRIDSYNRAREMGINVEKCWISTLDKRTRHAHRELDGVTIPVNEPFENELGEIMYPGDPNADGANVWNCRCTLISQIKGFEIDTTAYRGDPDIGGMTYDEWKADRSSISRPINHQTDVGKNIRMAWSAKYRRG